MGAEAQAVDPSLFEGEGSAPAVRVNNIVVRFYKRPVRNELKSYGGTVVDKKGNEVQVEGEGRPIFDMVEYIEKVVPGDRTLSVDRPVREPDRREFAQQYAAFKRGDTEQLVGTPLSQWPAIDRNHVEELAHFRVRTVEQLAELSDGVLQGIGPFLKLRQMARDWLEAAKGAAPMEALRSALHQRDAEVAALRQQVKELAELSRQDKRK